MKEDRAGYLQKENMGLLKCRFVRCEVPETFLAATVDCIFENCQFSGKRHDWPIRRPSSPERCGRTQPLSSIPAPLSPPRLRTQIGKTANILLESHDRVIRAPDLRKEALGYGVMLWFSESNFNM